MEDDEGSGPLDMTGSDILPPLAHSTNPLFPNAIVKKPPNNHSKAGPKAGKATSDEKKEEKEAKKAAAAANAVPPPPPKPYVGKNGPVS
jgi:DNA polymerase epsilon subunit 4